MSRRAVLSATLLVLGSAACLGDGGITDTGAPAIVITSPTADIVSGTVTIRATVVDDAGVDAVGIFVDDTKLVELRIAPFEYIWASTSVPDGQHLIRVTAKDISGNSAVATKPVTVNNQPN